MPLLLAACATVRTHGYLDVALRDSVPGESLEIYWELAGRPLEDGAPVFLIFHGGPGFPQERWAEQRFWQELGRHASLVYFHHRGSGRSSPLTGRSAPPELADAYSAYQITSDAEALRRAIVGPERPVFAFGHSFGGQLALLYAARFPRQVHRAIVVSTALDHRWLSEQRANLENFLDELVEGRPDAASALEQLRGEGLCEGWSRDTLPFHVLGKLGYTRVGQLLLREALSQAGRGDIGPLCTLTPRSPSSKKRVHDAHALYRTIACRELGWGKVSPANCTGVAPGKRLLDLSQALLYAPAPMLGIGSRHDPIVPQSLQKEMETSIGWSGSIWYLEDAGHDPLAESPEKCLQAVLSFLREAGYPPP